jgi:hypothetical protein
MIPKSGNRFSDKIMLKLKSMIPKKPAPDLIRGGNRFPAFSNRLRLKADFSGQEPALAGEGRSDKIMLKLKSMIPKKPAPDLIRGGNRFSEQIMLEQKARAWL